MTFEILRTDLPSLCPRELVGFEGGSNEAEWRTEMLALCFLFALTRGDEKIFDKACRHRELF